MSKYLLTLLQSKGPYLGKVMKFGTQMEGSLNYYHSKSDISIPNPLAPPTGKFCPYVKAINF